MKLLYRAAIAVTVTVVLSGCNTTGTGSAPANTTPVAVVQPDTPASKTNLGTKPVVMVLIDEQNLGAISVSDVEILGSQLLKNAGCNTVDQDMLRTNIEQRKRLLQSAGDNRGAAAVGQQFGAEVIIIGDAICQPAAQRIGDSNLRSYQAVVALRCVRTDNASVLASLSETATALDMEDLRGGSKALKQAGQKALESLIPNMITAWQGGDIYTATESPYPHRIELTFGGVDQLWKVKALRERLKESESANDVVQRSYTAGAAIFDLNSKVPAEEFAEDLVLNAPENITLQALSVNPGKLVFRVVTN